VTARGVALTLAALVAFAANSLLCRAALGHGLIDAASFTTVRVVSGAVVLALVARVGAGERAKGSWASAAALYLYAIAFSFAYRRIPAGAGALLLFGSVQATMIGADLSRGGRPRRAEWIGLLVSVCGLSWLAWPGSASLDPGGSALMAMAGVAWGVYSLRGRGTSRPLDVTADNFLRAVPLALLGSALSSGVGAIPAATTTGLILATISGALTSGLGYVVWYAALQHLTATRAAIVQLAVPVLAAAGGVVALGESVSARLLGAALLILGGIAIAVSRRR
jgi:drug/metabolite transporter (DMT)-like permease